VSMMLTKKLNASTGTVIALVTGLIADMKLVGLIRRVPSTLINRPIGE
jgi:hypothetical protein